MNASSIGKLKIPLSLKRPCLSRGDTHPATKTSWPSVKTEPLTVEFKKQTSLQLGFILKNRESSAYCFPFNSRLSCQRVLLFKLKGEKKKRKGSFLHKPFCRTHIHLLKKNTVTRSPGDTVNMAFAFKGCDTPLVCSPFVQCSVSSIWLNGLRQKERHCVGTTRHLSWDGRGASVLNKGDREGRV